VDDHPQPVDELERICNRHLAYAMVDTAMEQAEKGSIDEAMQEYGRAVALDPHESQLRFWFALELADRFQALETVTPIFRELFSVEPMWAECLIRYGETNSLQTPNIVNQILALRG
jgi:uncharacterized Ntn-hydrolase superfamily protein